MTTYDPNAPNDLYPTDYDDAPSGAGAVLFVIGAISGAFVVGVIWAITAVLS